ncbi:MAG TPA: hypothetical protein VIH18_15325 [Candidatus Binatia bacterium]|jgi:hypothetical protein
MTTLVVVGAAFVVAGCTIGPVGAIAGRVSLVQGGWVLETYTIGGHVRTALADDPGFGLGAAKRSYLFAEEEAAKPAAGWYLFLLPPVSLDRALLRDVEIGGIDLHLGAPEAGLTLGFQRLTATRPAPVDRDAFHDLMFIPESPVYACVSTQMERSC